MQVVPLISSLGNYEPYALYPHNDNMTLTISCNHRHDDFPHNTCKWSAVAALEAPAQHVSSSMQAVDRTETMNSMTLAEVSVPRSSAALMQSRPSRTPLPSMLP